MPSCQMGAKEEKEKMANHAKTERARPWSMADRQSRINQGQTSAS